MDPLYATPYYIIKKLQRNCLQRMLPAPQGKVLDAGCGPSPFKQYFAKCTYISMDSCALLAPRVCGTCAQIPFKDESFDIVVCTEVLEHVQDMQEALHELARVVKKGGRLYLTVPQSWPLHYEPYDFWRVTGHGVAYLLARQNLQALSIRRIGGLMSLLSQHTIDSVSLRIAKCLEFLNPRDSQRIATLLCLPASLLLYQLSNILDRADTRFALGTAALAKK